MEENKINFLLWAKLSSNRPAPTKEEYNNLDEVQKAKEKEWYKELFKTHQNTFIPQQIEKELGLSRETINTFTEEELINKFLEATSITPEIKELREQVLHFLLMKNTAAATEIITKHIERKNKLKTLAVDEKEEVWIYKEGIYKPNGKSAIQAIARKILLKAYTPQLVNKIIAKIEADTQIQAEEFFNNQNKHKNLIPVNNGLLNIHNRELQPFNHEIYFFNKMPMDYNPETKCPKIKQFIAEIVKDQEAYNTIQEILGYCLTKNYNHGKAIMFEGQTASNGKSVLCNLMKQFVNEDNCSSVNIKELDERAFSLIDLHNKLINFSMEISRDALDNKGKFKSLTGEDAINAERKFKTSLKFTNYAKMIFTANELPIPKNPDEGFWRRWIRIEFPNRFLQQKEIDQLKPNIPNNVKLRKNGLLKEISTDSEMEGLLNFALDGLKRLESHEDFSYSKTVEQNKKGWLRKSNSFYAFCEEKIEESYEGYIAKEELRKQYGIYIQKHNLRSTSDKAIKITLESDFGTYEGKISLPNDFGGNDRINAWKGIKFK